MKRGVLAVTAALFYLGSCANATVLRPTLPLPAIEPVIGVDDSAICRGLAERFVGLPAAPEPGHRSATVALPLAGRWWVRSCSATRSGEELTIRLKGPGWYWIEQRDSGVVIRQQVPFQLQLALVGKLDGSTSGGVFYLWFAPTRPALVQVSGPASLDISSDSAFGWLLTHLPLAAPGARAAKRFRDTMTDALRHELANGATVTYDFGSGQADATIGRLEAGQAAEHPFKDGAGWLANERLLLPPSATHVMGPFAPGSSRLDIDVERGPGVTYRAICTQRASEAYAALAAGTLTEVPSDAWVEQRTISGSGRHSGLIAVNACSFYLVLTTSGSAGALAAVRLRS